MTIDVALSLLQMVAGCILGGVALALVRIAVALLLATPHTNSIYGVRLRESDRAKLRERAWRQQ